MTPDEARQRFVDEHQTFKDAAVTLRDYLDSLCRTLRVPAAVEAREKAIGSFVKKVYLNNYTQPWEEVTDKVGARIIVDTLEDVQKLRGALEGDAAAELAARDIVDKSEESAEDKLHYAGVHAQVTVPGNSTADGELIDAELQIRTKSQDLWAAVSHKLDYKGAITPAKQTRRRILRLSVLTEMFDEEVGTAMNELAADPAYLNARYLQFAEAEYLRFVGEPGNDLLSLEVIETIRPAMAHGQDPDSYAQDLREFVDHHIDKLQRIYARYGLFTEWAQQPAYWLFSQPESTIVFHLIETRSVALSNTVRGTELETVADRLYAAWGRAMPAEPD